MRLLLWIYLSLANGNFSVLYVTTGCPRVSGEVYLSRGRQNAQNSPVHLLRDTPFQVATYFSNKGFQSHVDEVVISQVYRGRVSCGESDTWDAVPINVPPLPPTSRLENFCKLMDIEYRLDVSIPESAETWDQSVLWHRLSFFLARLTSFPFRPRPPTFTASHDNP